MSVLCINLLYLGKASEHTEVDGQIDLGSVTLSLGEELTFSKVGFLGVIVWQNDVGLYKFALL